MRRHGRSQFFILESALFYDLDEVDDPLCIRLEEYFDWEVSDGSSLDDLRWVIGWALME